MRKENVQHAMRMSVYHENDYGHHRKRIHVRETGKIYSSMNTCERDLGIDHSEISKYLSGKITYQPKGYAFDLVE